MPITDVIKLADDADIRVVNADHLSRDQAANSSSDEGNSIFVTSTLMCRSCVTCELLETFTVQHYSGNLGGRKTVAWKVMFKYMGVQQLCERTVLNLQLLNICP
jgi:hypothetical protein